MLDFEYRIIRGKGRKRTTAISVSREKGVIVSAPQWVPEFIVRNFVAEKAPWILKQLNRLNSAPQAKQKEYTSGELHLYFGEEYPLIIQPSSYAVKPRINFIYNQFEAVVPKLLSPSKQKLLLKLAMLDWYLVNGKRIITDKVNYFTEKLGVPYNRITLKKVSSIWGSCSRRGNLNFNRKLIMAPHKIVDYVVIHEVCHLKEHNHSSAFWKLVASFDPDFKAHRKWLHDNSLILSI